MTQPLKKEDKRLFSASELKVWCSNTKKLGIKLSMSENHAFCYTNGLTMYITFLLDSFENFKIVT